MPVLRLRSIAGARRGPETVFSGPRVRIGRSRDNDLILPDKEIPAAGGHHAEALLDSSGAWWIVDGHSANGTFLNGQPIARHVLKSGDRLTFGDEQFVVTVGSRTIGPLLAGVALVLVVAGLLTLAVGQRMDRRRTAPFERVAAAAARSVFLIALEENGRREPIGTAFAIGETAGNDALVSNAHIAALLDARGALSNTSGRRAVAVRGDTFTSSRIVAAVIHPGWRPGSIEKDVALLELERGSALVPLALGDGAAVSRLARGTPVAAFGFPAVSTDALHPRGRLAADVVGDVRGDYLETGLGIAPGTSGSPVFDQSGVVVGIVVGGDFVGAPGEPARPSGSAANWALTASVVRELLAERPLHPGF